MALLEPINRWWMEGSGGQDERAELPLEWTSAESAGECLISDWKKSQT